MPDNIKGQYQYYTQADLGRLRSEGAYEDSFYSLEDVADYVQNYLNQEDPYL